MSAKMASQNLLIILIKSVYSFIFIFLSLETSSGEKMAPALFVFGDSLVDVGNNNYLTSTIAKSNYAYYGIDFLNHKPTGRFSNGKNVADFIAEKLGLPSPEPYYSLINTKSSNFFLGVSFASAAAGILNETNQYVNVPANLDDTDQFLDNTYQHTHFMIPMDKQIEYYTKVTEVLVQKLGKAGANKHLSKSVFAIVIGNTDIGEFFTSKIPSLSKKEEPQQYVHSMLLNIRAQLKRIYELGGRKFIVAGLGAIGCIPSQKIKTKTGDCNEEVNSLASNYNEGLQAILQDLKTELMDFQYTYLDTYNFLLNVMDEATYYGFKEVKAACCGLGELNADVVCNPTTSLCPNRSDHIFWDRYHPTEAVIRIFLDGAFVGSHKYAFSVNVQQLVSL